MTEFDDKILEFVRRKNITAEELTEKQMAETIKQALACGDIVKYVVQGRDAQSIVYMPFAESERLRSRILRLESALVRSGIQDPDEQIIEQD